MKPTCYLTATHSICTEGGVSLTVHEELSDAEMVLELGALGQLYECHLLADSASPAGAVDVVCHPSPAERLAAAEAEVARLTAALDDAEERAAGPFLACCGEAAAYGRRLDVVLDEVTTELVERLEAEYDPDEWATAVSGWEFMVEHGVHLSPCLDDDGEPAVYVSSRQGFWMYDLRLTVTDGQPVLTAERRARGAR